MSALPKIPTVETIVAKVLTRPRYLNGYTLAEFVQLNREHLTAYFDAQCAFAEEGEVLPGFDEWCAIQFDLACEFRARMDDEARQNAAADRK